MIVFCSLAALMAAEELDTGFWGIEVAAGKQTTYIHTRTATVITWTWVMYVYLGQSITLSLPPSRVLRISQAALGNAHIDNNKV
jgi:hypothetical protein